MAKIGLAEEISWRRKCRALLLRQLDIILIFSIGRPTLDGVRFDVLYDMKSAVYDFYKYLFTESKPWRPNVDGLFLPSLCDTNKEIF